jgi:hypothetical protein
MPAISAAFSDFPLSRAAFFGASASPEAQKWCVLCAGGKIMNLTH